jgi:hypothetical protein
MFLAVWMLYAADRLLDARPVAGGGPPADLEERHRFHHRHRRAFLWGLAIAAIALGSLLHLLNPTALHLYATLATLLAAWMLLVHARPMPESLRLPKELAVGVFFSAAVFIPTVARSPALRTALLPDALLAAAACTLNCFFLSAWEQPGPRPKAHWTTLWSTRHLPQLTITVAVLATLTAWLTRQNSLWKPALASALTAALLLLLHRLRRHLSRIHLRASADLALLTPLLFLFH